MKNKLMINLATSILVFGLALPTAGYGQQTTTSNAAQNTSDPQTAVDTRVAAEQERNEFLVSFYKPTYILPYYYTSSPYQAIYVNNTPNNESLDSSEAKFQISFKVPVWQNIFRSRSSLFLAYSQLSYWQVYNKSEFFRETNYEPEIFLSNQLDWHLFGNWKLNFFNIGANHQSNGRGGNLERSWNRAYVEGIVSNDNWMISFKPWTTIFRSSEVYNPDITDYLGYERILISYKYYRQVFSFEARNTFESGFSRGAMEATWSFPLTKHISGFVQLFSGYGQSLIEYNHYTNGAGIGIALSNWL